ncbi:hypothetical protein [Antrihabitans stalactiti]|uniref:GAF domain-containing protein n=1 Tax=Antrihabitans stalactiti TaxID=2584121 RepID=A0A848KK41_9NOCA|nr:hypothetical protein [Antrihabitans stalactiti]NMN98471.1 hypothetical protein [Antrihabitans stalactiti]
MKPSFKARAVSPGPIANWTGVVFGIVGTCVTIFATIATVKGRVTPLESAFLTAFIVLTYVALTAYMVRVFSRSNQALVESVDNIRKDFESLRNAQRAGMLVLEVAHTLNDEIAELRTPLSKRETLRFMRTACNDMARSFTDALGVDCRVCVKEIVDAETARPRVRAVVRSNRHVGGAESELHYIDQNTDFNELYREGKKFWFSNNVDLFPGYRNSSPNRTYKSTVVWPILTRTVENNGDDNFAPIAAFLCIDSDPPDTFTAEIHVPLGWSVADAIARAFESDSEHAANNSPPARNKNVNIRSSDKSKET